ncbi:uncharacterized protein LOC131929918 [Physella acuta]|uniref:uncharacterized protein LOC131929918 n=1 Tax=Physella acuta TaxID=109671 RepID=UPI0027DC7253|nr:uncharacterized protein LOC131929918 [Physella acuta]
MGVMSKTNRLPERPKPPSWEAISSDLDQLPQQIQGDVVFQIGKDTLASTTNNAKSYTEKQQNSDETETDLQQINLDEVESSYSNVLKLINLYTDLKEVPGRLENQYLHLKEMGQEMLESMSQLKSMAESFSDSHPATGTVTPTTSKDLGEVTKTKTKQKKKK